MVRVKPGVLVCPLLSFDPAQVIGELVLSAPAGPVNLSPPDVPSVAMDTDSIVTSLALVKDHEKSTFASVRVAVVEPPLTMAGGSPEPLAAKAGVTPTAAKTGTLQAALFTITRRGMPFVATDGMLLSTSISKFPLG